MKVGLETIAAYMSETVLKREDLAYLDPVIPEEMKEFLLSQAPEQVPRIRDELGAEILGEKVAKKALDSASLKPSDIDFIISGNFGGRFAIPFIGGWLHHKLGFPEDTPVLNVHNCCAGFIDGLNVAWNLLRGGEYRRIIVVMVTAWDVKGEGLMDRTSPFYKIFGDSAGAAIVSSQNLTSEFLSYHSRTFGEWYPRLPVLLGSVENPSLMRSAGTQVTTGNYFTPDMRFMEWLNKKADRFAIDGIDKALKKTNLKISDVDMVFYHQVGALSEPIVEGGVKHGISRDKWKDTFFKYGNIGMNDTLVNLAELWEEGKIPKNSIIALWNFAGGGHSPCMIIKWLAERKG